MTAGGSSSGSLAERFDAFVIDLDGVVYVGPRLLPGAGDALRELRRMEKHLLFLTNDPRGSRADYAERLKRLGVRSSPAEILTAGAATAAYIQEHEHLRNRRAFVIGSDALKEEIRAIGLDVTQGEAGTTADIVVVGGHEGFHYRELRIAAQAVRSGAVFYATNRDATFPTPDGPWPASGAILAAVETASQRRARVIGKPESYMYETATSMLRDARRIAVIGDSLESDIEGGRRAGLETILVAPRGSERGSADHIIPDLTALLRRG